MKEIFDKLTKQLFETNVESFRLLGKGFYAKAYLIRCKAQDFVIKVFNDEKYAKLQSDELEVLRPYLLAPKTFLQSGRYLAMEYFHGVNCGYTPVKRENSRKKIGEEIAQALANLHTSSKSDTYGEIYGEKFATWREFYGKKSLNMFADITTLFDKQLLCKNSLNVLEKTLSSFDKIFNNEPQYASLTHGDFNTRNIIINRQKACLVGIIDPMRIMYADSEVDLFQLSEANGKDFGLLEAYAKIRPLSENFSIKNAFYKTFAELNHYASISHAEDSNSLSFVFELQNELEKYDF